MELQNAETSYVADRLTYTKPKLTVFGNVRSLTASGTKGGKEETGQPNPAKAMV